MSDFHVIIDADACPRSCLQIVQQLAPVYHYEVITVASFNHQIDNPNHIVVGNESQAADMAIINHSQPGDIVVTQDWGLAAILLARNVKVISPIGKIYHSETIDLLLEERNMLAKYRRGGGRTKGPAKRSQDDDQRFRGNFVKLLKNL